MTIDSEKRAKLFEMASAGKSSLEIARELNVGKSTVSTILRKSREHSEAGSEVPPPDTITIEEESVNTVENPRMVVTEVDQNNFLASVTSAPPAASPAEAKSRSDQSNFLESFASKIKKKPGRGEFENERETSEPVMDMLASLKTKGGAKKAKIQAEPTLQQFVAPPEPEPVLEKGELIGRITSLVTNFYPILQVHVKDPEKFITALPHKSHTELKTTLEMLENTMNITNTTNGLLHVFGTVTMGIEILSSKVFKMKTEGFSKNILSKEDQLRMIFTDISFSRAKAFKRINSPEAQLALLLCTTLMMTDAVNRSASAPQNAPVREMAPGIAQEFSDL